MSAEVTRLLFALQRLNSLRHFQVSLDSTHREQLKGLILNRDPHALQLASLLPDDKPSSSSFSSSSTSSIFSASSASTPSMSPSLSPSSSPAFSPSLSPSSNTASLAIFEQFAKHALMLLETHGSTPCSSCPSSGSGCSTPLHLSTPSSLALFSNANSNCTSTAPALAASSLCQPHSFSSTLSGDSPSHGSSSPKSTSTSISPLKLRRALQLQQRHSSSRFTPPSTSVLSPTSASSTIVSAAAAAAAPPPLQLSSSSIDVSSFSSFSAALADATATNDITVSSSVSSSSSSSSLSSPAAATTLACNNGRDAETVITMDVNNATCSTMAAPPPPLFSLTVNADIASLLLAKAARISTSNNFHNLNSNNCNHHNDHTTNNNSATATTAGTDLKESRLETEACQKQQEAGQQQQQEKQELETMLSNKMIEYDEKVDEQQRRERALQLKKLKRQTMPEHSHTGSIFPIAVINLLNKH